MTSRYQKLFEGRNAGAFIPFTVLGDPDLETSFEIIETLIAGGADALELGLPFSDPIADGPLIQKASLRALEAGVIIKDCFQLISRIRAKYPDIPIGLLVYANLVETNGADAFYKTAAEAGVDSVLIADIPVQEIADYKAKASAAGIETVLILPLEAAPDVAEAIAKASEGYLYLLSRRGVTGVDTKAGLPTPEFMQTLKNLGAAPPVLGFGISSPDQVKAATQAGCSGAISGSAVVKRIEDMVERDGDLETLQNFIQDMKAATL